MTCRNQMAGFAFQRKEIMSGPLELKVQIILKGLDIMLFVQKIFFPYYLSFSRCLRLFSSLEEYTLQKEINHVSSGLVGLQVSSFNLLALCNFLTKRLTFLIIKRFFSKIGAFSICYFSLSLTLLALDSIEISPLFSEFAHQCHILKCV